MEGTMVLGELSLGLRHLADGWETLIHLEAVQSRLFLGLHAVVRVELFGRGRG